MHIILTGATGFAGGEVFRQALLDPAITRVTVLTRRTLALSHPKLHEFIVRDFLDYTQMDLASAAACIWCLGTSQVGARESDYIRVTVKMPVAAARAMHEANPGMRFCFVSGRSADPSGRSRSLFARIKGRAEHELADTGIPLFVFRPGYIQPTSASGPRRDAARFLGPIGALFSLLGADYAIDCDHLARCLLDVAKHGADRALLLNRELHAWPVE